MPSAERLTERKVFAGPRIRRMRRELGLTQMRMAEDLGISPSYLNLIEGNQRPVSAQLLLKLAETYDIELRSLTGSDEALAFAELNEVFSDPLFQSSGLGNQDLHDVAARSPQFAEAVSVLYRAYRNAVTNTTSLAEQLADNDKSAHLEAMKFPVEEVREFILSRKNHFPSLDQAAEELHEQIRLDRDDPYLGLRNYLSETHNVGLRLMPVEVTSTTLRRYDHHRRLVLLSELLDHAQRSFQLAYQIAFLEQRGLMDGIVAESGLTGAETQRLLRVNLANYFASALLMPYERFLKAAESLGYDIELLGRRFGTSFEQVCHRLTAMQRPGTKAIPFFLIRLDNAGNVSKRLSAGGFHFSKYGGTCPRWNVHDAFRTPGKVYTQLVQLPDDTTYFSIARTVSRAASRYGVPDQQQLVVGLGCEIGYARRLVYSKGYDLENLAAATPIGVNCRLCERPDCGQRAFPPLRRKLVVEEQTRGISARR
jgi:predicted transcriptional regulator/transcriptional regulator with XRE-family HTH domain